MRRVAVLAAVVLMSLGAVAVVSGASDGPRTHIELGDRPSPSDIAVGEGYVWVTDVQTTRFFRIHPTSNEVDTLKLGGHTSSQFVATGDGAVWVYADVLKRVDPKRFVVSGKVKDPKDLSNVVGLATGAGAVWMLDDQMQVVRVDPATLAVTTIPLRTEYASNATGFRGPPLAVTDDAAWAVDPDAHLLYRVDVASNAVTTIDLAATEPDLESVSVDASEVAVALDGSEESNDVFCPVDTATGAVSPCVGLGGPAAGDATRADDSFWFIRGTRVVEVDSTGQTLATTPADKKGPGIQDIAVGLGSIWAIDGAEGGFYSDTDQGVQKIPLPRER